MCHIASEFMPCLLSLLCMANKKTTVIALPPYLLDLVSCDLFVFPKLKMALKGGRFNGITIARQNCGMLLRRFEQCTSRDVLNGDNY
jgi:hypothetical protein